MDGAGGVHGGVHGGGGGTALPFTGEAIPMRRDIDMLKGGQQKTLNEMEAELHSLHKENFDLKMTIYYQKDKIERLNGGEMDSGERERDLEEHIADLEYRMQEKDARLEELEAFLAHHHHHAQQQQSQQQQQQQASRDLKDEMRQVSAEAAAEAQEALARGKAVFAERLADMQALLGRTQAEKKAAEEERAQARVEAAEWQQKVRVVEEARGMLQRELEGRLHEARRASEDAQARHTAELARAQEEAAEAASAATAAASQLLAVSSRYQQQQQFGSSDSRATAAAVEEHRFRAEAAEQRVRELETKLGDYQAELREWSRSKARTRGEEEAAAAAAAATAAAAASASASAAMWRESLEAARRELQRERADKEAALRALEDERVCLNREKAEWRQGERGAWTELNQLKDQLANEKRAKDALLLDMADIRRHGKQQLRELLSELKEFDRVVEGNLAELFETAASAADEQEVPINTPLKQLLAAEEDAGRRRGLLSMGGIEDPSPTKQLALALEEEGGGAGRSSSNSSSNSGTLTTTGTTTNNLSMQASGKLMVRQAQDLVRKWRLKLQVLPSLNQRFRDATAQTVATFERKLSHMTTRLSTQEKQVHDAYSNLESLRATRTEAEQAHARELVRAKRTIQVEYQELLAQVTAEKNAFAARLARVQAEAAVDVEEAREAGREEGAARQGKKQEEEEEGREEALRVLKEEVATWAQRCEAEAAARARVGQEKEVLAGEKRRVQIEMDRLLRQLRHRDDIIAVFRNTLEAHGLDDLPEIGAQLALLQRHMGKDEGGREGGVGGERSTVVTLIKEGMEHAAAHLMSVGAMQTQGWGEGRELGRRAEELRAYGGEVAALVAMTKEMLLEQQQQQQQQQQQGGLFGGGGEGEGAVRKLLQENVHVASLLEGLYRDLQRLVQRALPPSLPLPSTPVAAAGRYSSPLRRPGGEGGGGGGGRSPYASPAVDGRRQASSLLGRSNNNNNSSICNSFASPMRSRVAASKELLLRSAASSSSSSSSPFPYGGGRMMVPPAAAPAAAGTASPTHRHLGNSVGSSNGGREGGREGGVLTRHQIGGGGGGGGQKPLANLEKISNDLQEIAAKLEHFKTGVSGGGGSARKTTTTSKNGGNGGGGGGGEGPAGAVMARGMGRSGSTVLNRLG